MSTVTIFCRDGACNVENHTRGNCPNRARSLDDLTDQEMQRVTITVDVHFIRADLDTGWNGDLAEMAASVLAALQEVIGDDGGAYPPNAVWVNQ